MIRIGLLGLGGVGGYFGAKLARTYSRSEEVEIVFLARERTAEAISRNGIRLTTPQEEFVAYPHNISSDASAIGVVDFLIVSVKSYDLEDSLLHFSNCIGPHTIILPLLNGIDSPERIRRLFPNAVVWQGCVYIVSRAIEPGVIKETGNIHSFFFGSDVSQTGNLQLLERVLKKSHEDIFLSDNIKAVVWEKFVFISTIASLTSYLDKCIGEILADTYHRKLLLELLNEIISAANAAGIILPPNIIPLTVSKMEKLPFETTSSMHSDFQRNSKTEVQSLTENVISIAHIHAIEVPQYEMIFRRLLTK